MAKHGIFHHRLARAHRLEKIPQMGFDLIPGDAQVADSL